MKLTHLTDKSLLNDTKALSQQYRYVTAKLLHHLKEIEKRKIFSDLGYSSLFDYVVRELGFSEPSAARRIQAARLLHSNFALQIDHRKPFALGGKTTLDNLRLLCRSCNQRARVKASL